MPDSDALAAAEWYMRATEYRVLHAMPMRASNDNDIDDARVSGLFSELQAAIAQFRLLKFGAQPATVIEPATTSAR